MTDTTAPALTWGEAFRGLLPSLNTCLVAIVTACLSIGGTILTTRMTTKPVEVVEPKRPTLITVEKVIERSTGDVTPGLTTKIDNIEAMLTELRAAQSSAGDPKRKRPLK